MPTRQESLSAAIALRTDMHSSCPDVFYFLSTVHILEQLPTHIAHISKASGANAETKAFPKSAILYTS